MPTVAPRLAPPARSARVLVPGFLVVLLTGAASGCGLVPAPPGTGGPGGVDSLRVPAVPHADPYQDPDAVQDPGTAQDPGRPAQGAGQQGRGDDADDGGKSSRIDLEVDVEGAVHLELEEVPPAAHRSFDLGAGGAGISFGNSENWDGLRFNARDHDAGTIRGLNVTFWTPYGVGIDRFEGLALGAAPSAGTSDGLRLGLGATVAAERSRGIEFAGAATVSGGEAVGIRAAGVAVASDGDATGIHLGGVAAVSGGALRGIGLGGAAVVAEGGMDGIQLGGLAAVSGGPVRGLTFGGAALVSEGGLTGIQVGGLATVSEGTMRGLQLGGLATVAEGGLTGIQVGGLATVSDGDVRGLSFGGLALVGEDLWGVQAAGLAAVASGDVTGLGVSGLALVSDGRIRGVHVSGGGLVGARGIDGIAFGGLTVSDVRSEFLDLTPRRDGDREASAQRGVLVSGFRIDASHVQGLGVAGVINRSHRFDGLGVAMHNSVGGLQRGLTVGLFNYARDLRGVQVGLLNHVRSNPSWARWLPLVNARF